MPDGRTGACRELTVPLQPDRYKGMETMLDYKTGKTAAHGELTPGWRI